MIILNNIEKNNIWKQYIHGTSIAGIIGSSNLTHEFSNLDPVKYFNDHGIVEVNVGGIAPKCKIQGFSDTPVHVVKEVFQNVKTTRGTALFPVLKGSDILLINLSAGEQNPNDIAKQDWGSLMQEACSDNYTLIIAAVGNNGRNINNEKSSGVWPAFKQSPKSCGESDAILRVGALRPYNVSDEPILHTGSNYGNKRVDILAPGQHIGALIPGGYATIMSGTSPATAIVAGLAAILSACQPYANAKEIRSAILAGAIQYDSLKDKVKDGRVLYMLKSVKEFCFFKNEQTESECKLLESEC